MSTAPIEGWAKTASLATLKTTYYKREVYGEQPIGGYPDVVENMSLSTLERSFFELVAKGQIPGVGDIDGAVSGNMKVTGTLTELALSEAINGQIVATVGLNVRKFGAKGDGIADDTAAIQSAIDAASATNGGGFVVLSAGTYSVTTLTLRPFVTLKGMGRYRTVISARPSSAIALLQMPMGMSQATYVEDLQLNPGTVPNPGQHGFYAKAIGIDGLATTQGGWWYGGMRRVRINRFHGHGMWLRGGGMSYMNPHQFLTFDALEIFSGPNASCRGLLLTGQVGQVTWNGCEIDGNGQGAIGAGTSLDIRRATGDDGVTAISDASPYSNTFNTCTFQANALGASVQRASGTLFLNCWFEDLASGLEVSTSAENTVVESSSFGDAGKNSFGTGYCIKATSASVLSTGNRFVGEIDAIYREDSSGFITHLGGYSASAPPVTVGMTKQVGVVDGTLNITYAKTLILSSATDINPLKTITSKHMPGTVIHFKAWTRTIVIASGGNIGGGGHAFPIIVPQNAVVSMVKYDLGGAWEITSISKV